MTLVHRNESIAVTIVLGLGVLIGLDALREVPPLGDDYWIVTTAPLDGIREMLDRFGLTTRPLGLVLFAIFGWLAQSLAISVFAMVVVFRILTLVLTYVVMRRLLSVQAHTAILALTFFALTPVAIEGWALLASTHQALSAPAALASCAFFARVPRVQARHVAFTLFVAAALQLATLALYEQALLMIPAFALLVAHRVRREQRLRAVATVVTAAAATAVWLVAMFLTGYVARRSVVAGSGSTLEASDMLGAADALWTGFVRHNIWRLVEFTGTGNWFPWDSSTLGWIAALSSLAIALLAAAVVYLADGRRSEPTLHGGRRPEHSPLTYIVAAYTALLPVGFAFTGFPSFSRMFYLPALGVALAIALLISRYAHRLRRASAVVVGAAVLWTALTFRDYGNDLRHGARMLRAVAKTTLLVPAGSWGEGVLILAPDVVGTFSSAAVQPWTVRPAAEWWWDRVPAGPLFFGGECVSASADRPVRDEFNNVVWTRRWGRFIAVRGDSAMIGSTLESVCSRETAQNPREVRLHEELL